MRERWSILCVKRAVEYEMCDRMSLDRSDLGLAWIRWDACLLHVFTDAYVLTSIWRLHNRKSHLYTSHFTLLHFVLHHSFECKFYSCRCCSFTKVEIHLREWHISVC